jgi:hypothetical protein
VRSRGLKPAFCGVAVTITIASATAECGAQHPQKGLTNSSQATSPAKTPALPTLSPDDCLSTSLLRQFAAEPTTPPTVRAAVEQVVVLLAQVAPRPPPLLSNPQTCLVTAGVLADHGVSIDRACVSAEGHLDLLAHRPPEGLEPAITVAAQRAYAAINRHGNCAGRSTRRG